MRRAAALAAGVVVLAGCGGSPRDDLRETADNVGKIRSGTIAFSLLVTPRTKLARHPFGFRLRGPFRFGERPTAHVVYTQIANGRSARAELVLEEDSGYAVVDGARRDLTAEQLSELRSAAAAAREGASVDVSSWVESAQRCDGNCVTGDLDVAAAIDTLVQYLDLPRPLTDDERDQLADATHATYRVLYTDDHLLRDLRVDGVLGVRAPPKLRAVLGANVGARLRLRLAVAHPSR